MAARKVSCVVRKGKPWASEIPGTKVSLHNSQLLVSSGIPSFDGIIGGGLPVGSLILVDEDICASFSKIFIKYFLAEGILSNQSVHVCSKDINPKDLVNELPGSVQKEAISTENEDNIDEEMKIAWRYQNMKLISSVNTNHHHFGHYFDLTKTLDSDIIKNSDITHWTNEECLEGDPFHKTDFALLIQSIKNKIENGKYQVDCKNEERKILRLSLFQLGSPLWTNSEKHLTTFLYCLRALLRNSFAVCMVTVPFHLYKNQDLKMQCIHLSDICIHLEAFSGTSLEKNIALRDYNGFFRVLKFSAINSLIVGGSPFIDLAIKLRRRKLVIEKLHLPPELEETTQREDNGSSHLACGSSKSRLLEF